MNKNHLAHLVIKRHKEGGLEQQTWLTYELTDKEKEEAFDQIMMTALAAGVQWNLKPEFIKDRLIRVAATFVDSVVP